MAEKQGKWFENRVSGPFSYFSAIFSYFLGEAPSYFFPISGRRPEPILQQANGVSTLEDVLKTLVTLRSLGNFRKHRDLQWLARSNLARSARPIGWFKTIVWRKLDWGTSRWPQPPRFSQKYCDTNGRRIAIQMGGALRCKCEEYWSTSLSWELSGSENTVIQIGGVLQYKLEVQKNPRVRKILSAILGPFRKWLRQFYGRLEECVRSAGKAMSTKFLVLGGGGNTISGLGGGGGVPILFFMGARIFLRGALLYFFEK